MFRLTCSNNNLKLQQQQRESVLHIRFVTETQLCPRLSIYFAPLRRKARYTFFCWPEIHTCVWGCAPASVCVCACLCECCGFHDCAGWVLPESLMLLFAHCVWGWNACGNNHKWVGLRTWVSMCPCECVRVRVCMNVCVCVSSNKDEWALVVSAAVLTGKDFDVSTSQSNYR